MIDVNTCNIIVIGYNTPNLDVDCLTSIVKNTTYPYLLTFYENYKKGKGLTECWNSFIEKSPCEFICLLNNDTKVFPNWLEKLISPLQINKSIGFTGPSTNMCHSPQKTISSFEEAQKYVGKMEIMEDPISGFCLVFRKSLWKFLGKFDERYDFYGSESDLIERGMQKGYKAAWIKGSFVYHIGSAAVNASDRDQTVERNRAKKLYRENRK